ncbi:MAG: hypothetical protein F4Y71_09115 [Acidobacteria bacterium]|nr:hypothetical protein [Acidobacteriota bacterium]MYG74640.1 hypothetical protein [Acidobacteriota bacterium]
MPFTIAHFFKPRLSDARRSSTSLLPGWRFVSTGLNAFVEAPLKLSHQFGPDSDPENADLILVSAPGAVGKSTLAQQVAHLTDSVHVDLAVAGPVAANTLSGGLLKSGLWSGWEQGHVALLVDGLDEARLHATPDAFDAFLHDVADLASGHAPPIVLFGRTRSVEESWLVLDDEHVRTAVLEIAYYDRSRAREFVQTRIASQLPSDPHRAVRYEAADLMLSGLREQVDADGGRFAGYAPVLVAVAERLSHETNPAALIQTMRAGQEAITLHGIVDAILDREHQKLRSLPFEDAGLAQQLYQRNEQLDHLVSMRYGTDPPVPATSMSNRDRHVYEQALKTWVPEHPFVGGAEHSQSAVFDAVIASHALGGANASGAALDREISRGAAANPFLCTFYPPAEDIPPGHIGVVYSSVRAQLALGETANLSVSEREADGQGANDALDVEISRSGRGENTEESGVRRLVSRATSTIRMGSHLSDAEITVPNSSVEIGGEADVTLVAPVSVECAEITVSADRLIVETASPQTDTRSVFLQAERAAVTVSSAPVLRGKASLAVSWPGTQAYPWTHFAVDPGQVMNPGVREGLRRLRRFVTACRAGGKGKLARFKGKMESPRMIKGVGAAILGAMVEEGILALDGKWYFLNTRMLGEKVGVNYVQCQEHRFGEKAVAFVERALEARP